MRIIKNRKSIKVAASIAMAAVVMAVPAMAFADTADTANTDLLTAKGGQQMMGQQGQMPSQMGGMGQKGGMMGQTQNGTTGNATSPSTITTSTLTSNSAESLEADLQNATTIVMSSENSSVKITEAGTYIVTGSCADGNITVKKGTTGVVLILKDLDLTSSTGATVSLNKGSEVKVIIEGTVKLTDAEDIANEDTDDFDGAALKAKSGSSVVLTGSGTLNINGSCKNGIKVSSLDEDDIADGYSEASFIIEGSSLTVNVTAEADGINSGTDLTIKSGNINVSAGDDGIKADYILTIGEDGTNGPNINVKKSVEGLEGATINIYSGTTSVTASDDGINAANSDLTGYTYSLNVMGGTVNVSSGADGIDSNGNVNLIGGVTTIAKAASNGGEGGLDYQGSCYIAEGALVNPYGTTMDSGMGGMMGGARGQMGQRQQGQSSTEDGSQQMPQFGSRFGQRGQNESTTEGTEGTEGTAPDGTSGATPQAGGMMGQRPQMDGQMGQRPQFGGQDGTQQMPQMDGKMGQRPQMDGEAPADLPQMDGQTSGEAPQIDQTQQDVQQNLNWFQRLIEIIKSWFQK